MISSPYGEPATLLHRFGRTFRVWGYGVSHSHLLLRSRKDGVEDSRLDLHFEAVDSMQLVKRYEDLELHAVDDAEFSRVYEESGVPPGWRDTRLVVRLRSRSGTGYVQCGRIVVDRHQDDGDGPGDESAIRDVVWSLRPSGLRAPGGPAGDPSAHRQE
ncbi:MULTISPECIES: hypothetical protein [Streptomyces]|uniref:Uncharacterized protein n=1 Tax=Streptomyces mutomycini TaxID=284036 RepID=A0ABW0AXH3_9ACTN|nr:MULTISPECIES: hypothetical protein [Streptomyces]